MARVELPEDRIFSQTVSGRPKSEVLELLQRRHPGATYHFVEDKLGTLEKVGAMWRCVRTSTFHTRACTSVKQGRPCGALLSYCVR